MTSQYSDQQHDESLVHNSQIQTLNSRQAQGYERIKIDPIRVLQTKFLLVNLGLGSWDVFENIGQVFSTL